MTLKEGCANKVLQKIYELRHEVAAATEGGGIISITLSRKAFKLLEHELNKSRYDNDGLPYEPLSMVFGIEIEMDHTT